MAYFVDQFKYLSRGQLEHSLYSLRATRGVLGRPPFPDTIEDDWIEDIERVEEELKSFTKPESPADVFSLRYGDFLSVEGDERGWEIWTKVVARRDIEERLMKPWNGR